MNGNSQINLDEFCEISKLTPSEKEKFTKYLKGKTESRPINAWLLIFNKFFDR